MTEHMMGKRELNKARKRAEIVDIATRSFFERGYADTSMSAIAEELGGSKATLWAHFSSKEDLFAAVIDQQVDGFSQDIDEVLTSQTYSVPALRRFCLRFLECLLRNNAIQLFMLVLGEGERFPEVREMFFSRGPAKIRQHVHEFYAPHFGEAEAEKLTQLTVSSITGFRSDMLLRPKKPSKAEQERYINGLVELIAAWDSVRNAS